MSATGLSGPIREINRLHAEVLRHTAESEQSLHAALAAAWTAGGLLLAEQKRVRQTMGAAWGEWLTRYFQGTHRTAQRYMRLAESVADVSSLRGLSLRQVYLRLGIATEPKHRVDSPHVTPLPPYIRLANRLLIALKASPVTRPEVRQDLRALYEQLRRLFESEGTANFSAPALSNRLR
jgi:hypothetical protein